MWTRGMWNDSVGGTPAGGGATVSCALDSNVHDMLKAMPLTAKPP